LAYLPAISAFSGGLATGWRAAALAGPWLLPINRFDTAITD
jgi:hypothetical protein